MITDLQASMLPADAQGYFNRGVDNLKSGHWKEALTDFTEAIKLRPDVAVGDRYRAYAHADGGNVPRAIADLDAAVRLKPDDAQISWMPAAPIPGGGREYLVTLGRRDIIQSYMTACADAGAAAGLVDLASLNLINAALASGVPVIPRTLRPSVRERLGDRGDRVAAVARRLLVAVAEGHREVPVPLRRETREQHVPAGADFDRTTQCVKALARDRHETHRAEPPLEVGDPVAGRGPAPFGRTPRYGCFRASIIAGTISNRSPTMP